MKYNFDEIANRSGLNSYKYQDKQDYLPMWIADMDFKTPDFIVNTLSQRLTHGCFGYDYVSEAFFQSIIKWYQIQHDVTIEKSQLLFSIGVMPSIISIIQAFSQKNDGICILTPTYPMFYKVIHQQNRQVLEVALNYQDNQYSLDFKQLEKQIAKAKIFLLCHPHNPIGKVYTSQDLIKIIALCEKYQVYLVSDEIHSDLVYTHFTSLAHYHYKRLIVLNASTKSFNLAGLKTSFIICSNINVKNTLALKLKHNHHSDINSFASVATVAAFEHGKSYLKQLKQYLWNNFQIIQQLEQTTHLKVVKLEATYLAWIDIQAYTNDSNQFVKYLKKNYNLHVLSGNDFLVKEGCFIRINFATNTINVIKACKILRHAIQFFK